MIASVHGIVRSIELDAVVIDANGIGLRIYATPTDLATFTRNEEGFLLTTMIVREDAMVLYGFSDGQMQQLFALLCTVSGVGPRLAMAVLGTLTPSELSQALAGSDFAALERVAGVGKRLAQRLVVELRDKVKNLFGGTVPESSGIPSAGGVARRADIAAALIGLGFGAREAEDTASAVFAAEPELTTQDGLRRALAILGRH